MFEMLSLSQKPAAEARSPFAAFAGAAALGAEIDFAYDETAPSMLSALREWLLAAALDEIDYGVLLVSRDGRVLHANHAARVDLDASHPLMLRGDELRARDAGNAAPLREALHSALQRGLRKRLTLADGDEGVSVSVVPLPAQSGSLRTAALLLLGKHNVCEDLSMQCYARDHGLTPAEERVLSALCRGQRPHDMAAEFGVAISTVRTQIGSIRLKTGAASIRAVVRAVATLPPLMSALRNAHCRPVS